MKILIKEKSGDQLSGTCNFVDLNIPDCCEREDCLPCLTAEKLTKASCRSEAAVNYKIQYLVCDKKYSTEAVYHGMSGYLAYFRGHFHADGFTRKVSGNILFDHQREYHHGKKLTQKGFRMTLIGTVKQPIFRLSQEGVMIANTLKMQEVKEAKAILMNNKTMFYHPGVIRVKPGGVFN